MVIARLQKSLAAAGLLVLVSLAGGCATHTVVPIREVIESAGTTGSVDMVSARIRDSKTTYALRGSDFAELSRRGVPPAVLDTLQQNFVGNVDMLTRFSALGESYGGCDWCYPQPVDLSNLERGGNGMTGQKNLSHSNTFARPQGVPGWVPAYPVSPGATLIGSEDVAQWAGAGTSPAELTRKIRASRYKRIIESHGAFSTPIRTQFSAGLKGSELAALSKQGVPPEALDALQEIFLAEYIDFSRQRYQNLGKGKGEPH